MSHGDQEPTLIAVSEAAQELLAEALRQRQVDCERRGEWLELEQNRLAIRCTAEKCQSSPQGWMVQLNFDIATDAGAGAVISDTCVGVGHSLEAAIRESISSWLDGVLSAVQQAFGATDTSPDVNVYDLTMVNRERAEETSWVAYAGPFQFRGGRDRQQVVATYLAEQPPLVTLLLDQLTDVLVETSEPLVWIKLLSQKPLNGQLVVECKANNLDWREGQVALARFAWPAGSDGILIKQFAVLKRGESRPRHEISENPPSQVTSDGAQPMRRGCLGMIALGSALIWLVILMFAQL